VFKVQGCKSEFRGDDQGKGFDYHWVNGSLLKLIESGYASWYLNLLNTYMEERLYTKTEHNKWGCEVTMWREINNIYAQGPIQNITKYVRNL